MSALRISVSLAATFILTGLSNAFAGDNAQAPLHLVVPPHLTKAPRTGPISSSGDWRTQSHLKTVGLRVYVLPDGTVGDAKVVVSSTFPEADTAAVKIARHRWKYAPGMIDGHATGMWALSSISFPYNSAGSYVDRSSEFKAQSLAYGEYLYSLEHRAEPGAAPKQ